MMAPRPAQLGNGAPGESRMRHGHTISGAEMGRWQKKLGWEEKWMDSRSLATMKTSLKFQGFMDMDSEIAFLWGGFPEYFYAR